MQRISRADRSEARATRPPAPSSVGLKRQRLADRPPRYGDGRQQPPRILGLPLGPLPEHFVEVELADFFPAIGRLAALDVLDQLVDEERIASRFARDHVCLGARDGVVAPQKRQCQLARLRLRQGLDGQLAMVEARGSSSIALWISLRKRLRLHVFRAKAADEEQTRATAASR